MQRTLINSIRVISRARPANTKTAQRGLRTFAPSMLAKATSPPSPLKMEEEEINDDPNSIKLEFKLEPLPRINEPIENKRARLLYQSRKRGILETDLILSRFAATYLKGFGEAELEEYDKFLDEYDWDIYYWVTGNPSSPVPERWQGSKILELVKAQVEASSKTEPVRMPEL
ncbi:Flavinator of succinate dehydrogenase-domain-containing protein [Kockiozyma suomiensis]|uniref:Flavinator of succinate dehydrogenase-domain-containing protein n=1 Tax=Kockiozyma suomiensis TaxID=1337062 RepID=UPI0033430D03